jgi:hypothetical protein
MLPCNWRRDGHPLHSSGILACGVKSYPISTSKFELIYLNVAQLSKIYLTFGQRLNGYRPNSAPHAAHCKSRNGGEETCYDRMFALPAEKNQGQRHRDASAPNFGAIYPPT